MSDNVRAGVGSVMKLERATVMASCANSRGRSSASRRTGCAPSLARDVFEEGRVTVRLAAETDDAHGDAERRDRLEQALVFARLLGVRRVGEQHDVPRPLLRLLHHRGGGDERGVGEDAAALDWMRRT